MARLPPLPALDWTPEGAPRARSFDDIYFSTAGGLAESEAVFVDGCGLPSRWAGRRRFSICELGFGAGLNALAVWRAWRIARPDHAILHMFSVEAFPLAREDAARALAPFAELEPLTGRLLARWPVRASVPQRLRFDEDGFALTLLIDDAAHALEGLEGAFDAWFLDGFAPARNPAMWSETVFARVAALSAPDARLASYSVAGSVRRALAGAGFAVEKKPGFGAKKERLEARLVASSQPGEGSEGGSAECSASGADARRSERPLPLPPPRWGGGLYPYAARYAERVAIIGAGVAGAAIAAALARRGVEVVVLETAPAPGAGASGNRAGLVMPRLDREGAQSQLHLAAYLAAIAAYDALGPGVFTPCGVSETPEPRARAAFADFAADPPLPPDWYAPQEGGGALHARAGIVRPRAAIEAWLANAQLMCEAPVAAVERHGGRWRVCAPDGRALLAADAVVLACGAALARLDAARFLPLRLSRGQIEWGEGAAPAHALVRGTYCAPCDGGVLFGSTFDRDEGERAPAPDAGARKRNLAALARLAPDVAASVKVETLRSRASLRASAPDFAPIAGLMPDAPAWLEHFAGIAHGRRPDLSAPPPALAGIYVLGGLGARGLTLAPLLAERIAAEICGEPQMLPRRVLDAIHPARFLHRQLKRGA
jgi:tRNA 5-methylaminomethyl-2-thiouridine biosynthesis bifunctional protein